MTAPPVGLADMDAHGHGGTTRSAAAASPAAVALRYASLAAALDESFTRHRDAAALVIDDKAYAYGQLWDASTTVLDRLAALRLPDAACIAMHAPSTMEAYAVMLGIVRSGRAYLPLNPALPESLKRRFARDAGACRVLSGDDVEGLIAGRPISPANDPHVNRRPSLSDRIGAIVYTSASSGFPKGVMLPERSILFHALTYGSMLGLTPNDRVTLFPSLFVGASVSNLFGAWLAGACLCRLSMATDGVEGTLDRIERERVTVLHFVPTVFRRLAEAARAAEAFRHVRFVKLGGETVTGVDADHFNRTTPSSACLLNGLGITEAGGNVTFGLVPRGLPLTAMAPIGNVVDGVRAAVLPENGHPDRGELVVRSAFLAAGYVGDDGESTFQVHDDGTRSFRTGDQVRRQSDGSWIHLGRSDQVVQVNGRRVSLPEVEAALVDIAGVEGACVFVDTSDSSRSRLVAAVRAPRGMPLSVLRAGLGNRLEPEKVPDLFYRFDDFPVLPGGKIDRRELQDRIQSAVPIRDGDPTDPQSDLETRLLRIWREVLRVPDLGVTDSVFEFGADSLVTADVLSRLARMGIAVSYAELLEHPTIARLATYLGNRDESDGRADSPVVLLRQGTGNVPLFIVPGAGSGALALLDLARSLPREITVYALHYPGIDDDGAYRTTVEELAAYFLTHLEHRVADGFYGLAGTSFGGMVAFEMARRLERSGREVPFLGLIDTYAPGYLDARPRTSLQARIRGWARWPLPVGAKHVLTVGNVARGLGQKWTLFQAGLWLRGLRKGPRPYERRFQYLMKACFMAGRRYRVRPVDAKIHFFSVEQQLPEDAYVRDPTLGWGEASRQRVEVTVVPGRHGAHIRPPHVKTLGERLGAAVMASVNQSPVQPSSHPETR